MSKKKKNDIRPGFVMFHDVYARLKEFPMDKRIMIEDAVYEASIAISQDEQPKDLELSVFDDKWMGKTAKSIYDEMLRSIEADNERYNDKVAFGAIGGIMNEKADKIKTRPIEDLIEAGCESKHIARVKKVPLEQVEAIRARVLEGTNSAEEAEIIKLATTLCDQYKLSGTKAEVVKMLRPIYKKPEADRNRLVYAITQDVRDGIVKTAENLKKRIETLK